MSLTNANINLIKAIADNNIQEAKLWAAASIKEDTTKKNEYAKRFLPKLESNSYSLEQLIPEKSKGMVQGFMPGDFNVDQYYLTDREEKVYKEIVKMQRLSSILQERNIEYKNTTLLYGPSGTGKTMFARYVAYKLHLPYIYCNFSQMIDSLMGKTARNISDVFEMAKTIPCVLVIDEIDCVAMKRQKSNGEVSKELERTTIAIMQELDKLPPHVVLIGCTNIYDTLDPALLRRFSVKHEVKEMSDEELKALVQQYLKATDSVECVSDDKIDELVSEYKVAGSLIPALIREIAEYVYANTEFKDEPEENTGTYRVTVSWSDVVEAKSMEEAMNLYKDTWKYNITTAKVEAKEIGNEQSNS